MASAFEARAQGAAALAAQLDAALADVARDEADASAAKRDAGAQEAYARAVAAATAPAGAKHAPSNKKPARRAPERVTLHVRCAGGSGFAAALSEHSPATRLSLHVLLREHRSRSRPVPSSLEPSFEFAASLDLGATADARGCDVDTKASAFRRILQAGLPPATIAVTSCAEADQARIVGHAQVDWHAALSSGRAEAEVQLRGVGVEAGVPAGTLIVSFEVTPRPPATGRFAVSEDELRSATGRQRVRQASTANRFLAYARSWWAGYAAAAHPEVAEHVRVLLPEVSGGQRACVATIRPTQAGRQIASPREAARFVSLLPNSHAERERRRGAAALGGTMTGSLPFAGAPLALAMGWASRLDHAALLCSFLLGFNLDAYVVLGRDVNGPHAWVLVRDGRKRTVFWESLTGRRYDISAPKTMRRCPYRAVSCAFSHKRFFANLCDPAPPSSVSFDFDNPSLWMAMDQGELAELQGPPPLALRAPTADRGLLEERVERALMKRVDNARAELGVTRTLWDNSLSYLLMPALAAYETEQIANCSNCSDQEFKSSIRRAVPRGHTFKAFPQQFTHVSADRMIARLVADPVCKDILSTRFNDAKFAIRCRVTLYPEDVVACWVMIAVCHPAP